MKEAKIHILDGDVLLPPAWKRFFPEPFLLKKLRKARLPVVCFAVTSPELYRDFRRTGGVPSAVAEKIVELLLKDNFSRSRKIVVRCPFVDVNAPLPEPANINLNATAIRGVIESFYRAWNNERFEHYRTTNGVPENIGPILILHRDCGVTGLGFSRSPRTGEKTDETNWDSGLVGAICRLAPETSLALRSSEVLLQYPVALIVTNVTRKRPLTICGVQRLELTAECSLRALIDMFQDGDLTLSNFLSKINVNWFRGATSFRVLPPSFKAKGLTASAGIAFAPAYLRPSLHGHIPHGGIFVVAEVSPEDLRMIIASQAVVATREGVSSHAALACRQMGIPCIVGVSALEIDYASRTIRAGVGEAAEGTLCMMDGGTGEVVFLVGGVDTVTYADVIARNTAKHLRILRALLGRVSDGQINRFTGHNAKVLSEIQSLFDLLDEP
jgi:phosphohistidine swiveling domain-containing protein